jgi:diaminopimelate epimerase
MHGTGNSFIIVRDHHQTDEHFQKIAQKICDYNFGIGADGLLVIAEATPR